MTQTVDEIAIIDFITGALGPVDMIQADGDSYFMYRPAVPPETDKRQPFATLVTGDRHDQVSDLDRPGVYRLNIGPGKARFQNLFGTGKIDDSRYDFAALDTIMPHPVYANMYFLCVLNPSPATFDRLKPMLVEAYEWAKKLYERRTPAA